MGDLFYRGANPTEIEAMDYRRLRYWHGWARLMADAERRGATPPPPK